MLPRQRIVRQAERAGELREIRRLPHRPRAFPLEPCGEMFEQLLDLRGRKLIRNPFDFGESAHDAENRVPSVQAQGAASIRARISAEESGEPNAGLAGSKGMAWSSSSYFFAFAPNSTSDSSVNHAVPLTSALKPPNAAPTGSLVFEPVVKSTVIFVQCFVF